MLVNKIWCVVRGRAAWTVHHRQLRQNLDEVLRHPGAVDQPVVVAVGIPGLGAEVDFMIIPQAIVIVIVGRLYGVVVGVKVGQDRLQMIDIDPSGVGRAIE
jgi:hypothetical protein